jgi:4a-hydroxytetrahydrobiopterin dehydratase
MSSLDDQQIDDALTGLPGWEYDGEAITKTYTWESFRDAIDFVNDIADLAEDENHHPDLEIYFDEVVVSLRTHSADAVTDRDVAVAGEIEAMLDEDDLDLDDLADDVDDGDHIVDHLRDDLATEDVELVDDD